MMNIAQPKQKSRLLSFNAVVLAVVVAIVSIGLLNLRNADFYSADSFHERQTRWYLLGFVLATLVAVTDLHLISRLAYVAYAASLVLLVAVLFTEPINNSRRWIFGIQPSEFSKITTVLALARYFHDKRMKGRGDSVGIRRWIQIATPFLIMLGPVCLIFLEPDLGTALIVVLIGLSMIFFQGVRVRSLITAVGIVGLIFPLAWRFALHDYQKARVLVWWDPDALAEQYQEARDIAKAEPSADAKKQVRRLKKILDKAYQPKQAVIAIGSGEFYGKGGRQGHATRQRHLPYLHTDFVIATWGEERGFIGCTLLLTLYYFLCYGALRVTKIARDQFQALLAVGICATIFWQFFVNVGMVTGLLPVVGVALPLLSYGGSSVLSICLGLGLLANVVRRQRATG